MSPIQPGAGILLARVLGVPTYSKMERTGTEHVMYLRLAVLLYVPYRTVRPPAVLGSTPCPTVQHVQNCNLFPFTAVLFMSSQKIANRRRKIANSLPLPVLLGEREDGMKLDQNKVILPHSIEALQ